MAFNSFSHNQRDDGLPMAEINVTPLVDVMLVLLIVFMITMPVLTHSIPLQLPTASSKQKNTEPNEPLRLSIAADGKYALGDKKVSLPELEQGLQTAQHSNPETILAIAADKGVAYDHVAQALGAARDAGLSKVGFVTEDNK